MSEFKYYIPEVTLALIRVAAKDIANLSDKPLEDVVFETLKAVYIWGYQESNEYGEPSSLESTMEHVARDIREGRFPQRSAPLTKKQALSLKD